MQHLHTFRSFISLFETRSTARPQTIILMGLPGSGKSTKAAEIKQSNPGKNYVVYDDSESLEALERVGKENQIISDAILTLDPPEGGLEDFEEMAAITGTDLQVMYFENDPKTARENVMRRWQSGQAQSHQTPELAKKIQWMSGRYKIPLGTKTIPVYRTT